MAEVVGPPRRVVVIGAGTMGTRIALSFAISGAYVCVSSRRSTTLESAEELLAKEIATIDPTRRPVVKYSDELMTETPADGLGQIVLTVNAQREIALADLIIETVREDLADKLAVLNQVQQLARDDAIVTTNTSSLDLAKLGAAITPPDRFAGLHWFNPANLVALVEIVPGPSTGPETLETLNGWMTAIGKVPVTLQRAVPGFVANRLQYALVREAYALVAEGVCGVDEVDRAVTAGLGPRWAALGPFQCMDFAGLDVHLAVARALFPGLSREDKPPAMLEELVSNGELGVKSGLGLRGEYSDELRRALESLRDEVLRSAAKLSAEAGSTIEPPIA
jgi:3-hydroxybutyryl-CoA dehydrogenase